MHISFKRQSTFRAIGIMSGTSLDGVDMAFCEFEKEDSGSWKYSILKAETHVYTSSWRNQLIAAETMSGVDLMLLHKSYGVYLGELISEFIKGNGLNPHFIASHGHTIFHQPGKKLTFQLGDGASIAATCGINTISDFRNLDVALGGQGAPLVPIGDALLFHNYDQCLNLGGFANISFEKDEKRIAFDICPVNIILNYLCQTYFQCEYDKNGQHGLRGKIIPELLAAMNNLDFYRSSPPKSLGKEWILENMIPLFSNIKFDPLNLLRTVYEHIAFQISTVSNSQNGSQMLVTGGGAYNSFLMELIKGKSHKNIEIPNKMEIEYKEALIFAFLGVLRYMEVPNCLASVTGAKFDNIGGIVHIVNITNP